MPAHESECLVSFPQTVLFLSFFSPLFGLEVFLFVLLFFFFRSCLVSLSLPVICEVESQVSLFGSDLCPFCFVFLLACLFSLCGESPLEGRCLGLC